MLDRPTVVPTRQITATITSADDVNNMNLSELSLSDKEEMRFFEKQLQYDRDIADYIAYLDRPIINVNDHYIEIHQYQLEPPVRPPTRRRSHKIDLNRTEVVEHRDIGTGGGEFLARSSPDNNQNIRIVSGRSSDEENKQPGDELDQHRGLSQTQRSPMTRVTEACPEAGPTTVRRGQTFSAPPRVPPRRGFLSFRSSQKNKSGRRRSRVVVGQQGIDGPIWPGVLLTFDRAVTPDPGPESEV